MASADQTLADFAHNAMSVGQPNRVPGPIATLIDVEPNTPVQQIKVEREQTTDGMGHLIKVMVEVTSTDPVRTIRPIGVVFATFRTRGLRTEGHDFRAALDGSLERAIVIAGANDEAGKAIKGSGVITKLDVADPKVQKRFQHELDFWLKRAYLRKGWRSAEFSGGVLRKKSKDPRPS